MIQKRGWWAFNISQNGGAQGLPGPAMAGGPRGLLPTPRVPWNIAPRFAYKNKAASREQKDG